MCGNVDYISFVQACMRQAWTKVTKPLFEHNDLHVCVYIYIHTNTHTYTYIYIYIYTRTSCSMYFWSSVSFSAVCLYVCMYTHIRMHTRPWTWVYGRWVSGVMHCSIFSKMYVCIHTYMWHKYIHICASMNIYRETCTHLCVCASLNMTLNMCVYTHTCALVLCIHNLVNACTYVRAQKTFSALFPPRNTRICKNICMWYTYMHKNVVSINSQSSFSASDSDSASDSVYF